MSDFISNDPMAAMRPTLVAEDMRGLLITAMSVDASNEGHGAAPLQAAPVAELPTPLLKLPAAHPRRAHAQHLIERAQSQRAAAKAWLADPAAQQRHRGAAKKWRELKAKGIASSPSGVAALHVMLEAPEVRLENMFIARQLYLLCGYPPLTDTLVMLAMNAEEYPDGDDDVQHYLRRVGVTRLDQLSEGQRWELIAEVWEITTVGHVGSCFNEERSLMGLRPLQVVTSYAEAVAHEKR
jgi:hypothetical protein